MALGGPEAVWVDDSELHGHLGIWQVSEKRIWKEGCLAFT
jgi:hypothetical protein